MSITLPFHRPLNSIILIFKAHNKEYAFFVDTGHPFSFSRDDSLTEIPAAYAPSGTAFDLKKQPWYIRLKDIEQLLGIPLQGFIGADFLASYNIELDHIQNKITLDAARPSWQPDFLLPLHGWTTELSYNNGPPEPWLIDTGSKLCCRWNNLHDGPSSLNHMFPSVYGHARFDLFANGLFSSNGQPLCQATISQPHLPAPNIAGVLGQNVLSQFQCYFDRKQNKLWLKKHQKPLKCWANPDIRYHSPGFQIILNAESDLFEVHHHYQVGGEMPPVGTLFSIPEIKSHAMNRINLAYEYLHPLSQSPPLVEINGQSVPLSTFPMFQ